MPQLRGVASGHRDSGKLSTLRTNRNKNEDIEIHNSELEGLQALLQTIDRSHTDKEGHKSALFDFAARSRFR